MDRRSPPPLSEGDPCQDLQGMLETADSTEPCGYHVFPVHTHLPIEAAPDGFSLAHPIASITPLAFGGHSEVTEGLEHKHRVYDSPSI